MAKAIYPVISIVNGQPTFEKQLPEILEQLKEGGAIKVLGPLECITDRQRAWYKGVCLPWLAKNDENGETVGWWDDEVKRLCRGLELLKKEIYYQQDQLGNKIGIGRLTTKGVGKRKMTAFIEEILSVSVAKGWGVAAPDSDLRKQIE